MDKKNSALLSFITDYVPLGYLYLIVLGIASDSIYYGFVGINIITYSSVLDVLLSPVARLTSSIFYPTALLLWLPISYFYLRFLKRLKQRQPDNNNKTTGLFDLPLFTLWLFLCAFGVFMFYIGSGIGMGIGLKKNLRDKTVLFNHTITFPDDEVQQVKLIGSNSGYVFYIEKEHYQVSISPIPNVKKIQRILPTN